jgi:aminomethyltransferase
MTVTESRTTGALFDRPADDRAAATALRTECAAFDRSTSGFVSLAGADGEALLQRLSTRDIEYLLPERSTTGLLLAEDGSLVDLVTVYRFDESFLVESGAGTGAAVAEHLRRHGEGEDVTVEDRSGSLSCVSVEGPYAWNAAGRIVAPELAALPLDSVIEARWKDSALTFCRSGVTGEYGYKFIGPAAVIAEVAAELAGELVVAGPEVLATAMLEVRHPQPAPGATAGQVVLSGASWLVDPLKDDFVGRDAFHAAHATGSAVTVGFVAGGDEPVAAGTPVTTAEGTEVGYVVASRTSVTVGSAIGLATLDGELACVGLELEAGPRAITTVASPFIVPQSWKTPIL